jgi:ribosomal protein L7Ae-like RNA K-turn-binding protein
VDCNYFSGSYQESDVRFLLQPITVDNTPVSVKEGLIQSGQKHYSEMLTHEKLPSEMYLQLFEQALSANRQLMATHSLLLARKILHSRPNGITLVSLARAGTPIGVLLKRILQEQFGLTLEHYSISIIRDVGIDENALLHILSRHAPETLVFVDGWTGKGVISRQLQISLQAFSVQHGVVIKPELYVLADLSGTAAVSASTEDYLIPSSILNATVSGLVSRSVIDKSQLSASDYHGVHYYGEYASADYSRHFVEVIMQSVRELCDFKDVNTMPSAQEIAEAEAERERMRQQSLQFIDWVSHNYAVNDQNLIKPGIGEATRVLLRREADLLLLRDSDDPSIKHLRYLAEEKHIPIRLVPTLPYRAAALIKERS